MAGALLRPVSSLPQGLIQLARPEQNVLQPVPHLLRVQRLLAHGAVRLERLDDGVHDRVRQVG